MGSSRAVKHLPTHLALDVLSVLEGVRPGASRLLDDRYYTNQRRVLTALGENTFVDRRTKSLRESLDLWRNVSLDFDSFSESALYEATDKLNGIIEQIPEVHFLRSNYPGTVIALPEWIRAEGEVKYGVRVHFRRETDSLTSQEIVQENVEAVINDTQSEYQAYLGNLHGYPECCVVDFMKRNEREGAPESRSIAPYESCVTDEYIGRSPSVSVDEILDGFFDRPGAYGFFAREFFPQPDCDRSSNRGIEIYETLSELLPEVLVRDYFRFNFLHGYVVTKSLVQDAGMRPEVGTLGKEHRYFSLPLQTTLTLSRYATSNDSG